MRFLLNDTNPVFDGALTNWSNMQYKYPPLNVSENDDEYKVEVELPGFKIEDVNLKLEDHRLYISSQTKNENEKKDEKKRYIMRERVEKRFERSLSLGTDVDEEKIGASFRNGILVVTLPKKENIKPKKIDVKIK